jgi:beta-glucanase (GH16 family)
VASAVAPSRATAAFGSVSTDSEGPSVPTEAATPATPQTAGGPTRAGTPSATDDASGDVTTALGPSLGTAEPTLPWTGASATSTPGTAPGSAAPWPWVPGPGPSVPSFPTPSPTSISATSDPIPPTTPTRSPLQPFVNPGTPASTGTWKQAFGDEFTDPALDATKWNTGRFAPSTTADNPYNNGAEAAILASRQVSVRGGYAVETIAALDVPQTLAPYGVTYRYTSGEINTRGTWAMSPGQYVEARIKVPSGDGLWPAFWLVPADGSWPPEIDVFEFGDTLRHPRPTFNYHYAAGGQSGPATYGPASSYVDAFHTYGMLWSTTGLLIAYLDGVPVTVARADSTTPMYAIINLGCFAGHAPASGTELLVDWVRAWTP